MTANSSIDTSRGTQGDKTVANKRAVVVIYAPGPLAPLCSFVAGILDHVMLGDDASKKSRDGLEFEVT